LFSGLELGDAVWEGEAQQDSRRQRAIVRARRRRQHRRDARFRGIGDTGARFARGGVPVCVLVAGAAVGALA
jgi:hypothetical protein